jgi:UDP:flavonoid glycosyltransferase YjiC (YdhE family)
MVYTLRHFQPFADDFPENRFHFIRPSVYDRREEDFPALSRPVIYISIGTILKDTAFSVLSDEKILENVQAMKETIAQAPGNAGAVKIIEKWD